MGPADASLETAKWEIFWMSCLARRIWSDGEVQPDDIDRMLYEVEESLKRAQASMREYRGQIGGNSSAEYERLEWWKTSPM